VFLTVVNLLLFNLEHDGMHTFRQFYCNPNIIYTNLYQIACDYAWVYNPDYCFSL